MTIKEIVDKFLEYPERMLTGAGNLSRQYRCKREDIYKAREIARSELKLQDKARIPKILILDIETAPLRSYVWRLWKQDVYIDQIISEWFMLTWSAKWLFDENVMSDRLNSEEVLREDDKRISTSLWHILNEADMVVAHNGDRFDLPKIRTRFLLNGLKPTSPYRQIDTKKVAKGQFGFSSNKLDFLAKMFGLEGKIDTDFDLWKRCLEGNEKALEYMETYNKKDILILEDVFLKLRPWIKSIPNIGVYMESDKPVCPHCGSKKLKESGDYYTNTSRYTAFQCDDCGAISRSRLNNFSKDKRNVLLTSIPK